MKAARSMALLALDATFCPRADQSNQAILVAFRAVAGCVASSTIIRLFLPWMVRHPFIAQVQVRVIEIVLGSGLFVTGNNEAILVDESGFPIITTNDIRDIIPSISFGRARYISKGIIWRLAILDLVKLPRMSALYKNIADFLVTFSTGLSANKSRGIEANPINP
jgi:hypothetical protein